MSYIYVRDPEKIFVYCYKPIALIILLHWWSASLQLTITVTIYMAKNNNEKNVKISLDKTIGRRAGRSIGVCCGISVWTAVCNTLLTAAFVFHSIFSSCLSILISCSYRLCVNAHSVSFIQSFVVHLHVPFNIISIYDM